MNKVMMIGRLTKDVELRMTQGANPLAVCSFSIAVDRRGKDKEVDFFNCTAFGKTAEFMEKYLMKGSRIAVFGRLQSDNYTNKEGQKVTAVKIIADEVEFADGAKGQKELAPAPEKKTDWVPIPDNVDDEELPFNFG